jgi:hypothetical protein
MQTIGSLLLNEINMTEEAKLLKLFESKGVFFGNELIVFKEFCRDFISASKVSGFAVLGIEGFQFFEDGSIKPVLNEISDFSDVEYSNVDDHIEECSRAATDFVSYMLLSGKSDGYSFVLTDSVG